MKTETIFSITRSSVILGNLLIAIAYGGLSTILIKLSCHERDFIGNKTFKLFGAFLVFASITRILRIIYFWFPIETNPIFALFFSFVDIITGVIAIFAFFSLFNAFRALKGMPSYKNILKNQMETQKELEKTRNLLLEIKEIDKKNKKGN